MDGPTTRPWLILTEPYNLTTRFIPTSEVDYLTKTWVDQGLSVLRIDFSKVVLVGTAAWLSQFVDLSEFNEHNKR